MAIWLPLVLAGLVTGSQFVTLIQRIWASALRGRKSCWPPATLPGRSGYTRACWKCRMGCCCAPRHVRVVVDEQCSGRASGGALPIGQHGPQAGAVVAAGGRVGRFGGGRLVVRAGYGVLAIKRQTALPALRDEAGFELRETAAYLVVECFFDAEEYAAAARAGEVLLRLFPKGRYAERTRYTLGWAWFYQQEYAEAVAAFGAYVQDAPGGIRADRARLQMGLALEALERYEDALAAFGPLADAYDPAGMADAEKRAVALAGLREGQSRRSLAAKAWIKRGDMLKALGRYEEALVAYKKVSRDFPQEPHLAEQAWVRQALLAQTAHGVDASLEVYRYAAEQAERPAFRARMQAGLMSLLFDEGRYEEALAAHRLYLTAYRAFAETAGVSVDEAVFRQAECLRLMGEESAVADSADVWFAEALGLYGEVGSYLAAGGPVLAGDDPSGPWRLGCGLGAV